MITIEEVQSYVNSIDPLIACLPEKQQPDRFLFAKLAISQHEEIERLRASLAEANSNHEHMVGEWQAAMREIERLQAANKDALAWFDDLKAEFDKVKLDRAEAYERAAKVCESERLHDGLNTADDIAYNNAIADAAAAIRALKTGEPK